MSLKLFLKKSASFAAVPAALFVIFHLSIICFLNESCIDHEIDQKLKKMVSEANPQPQIIISGDSRAERQVIPSVIASKTARTSVSVAVASGDLVTSLYSIKKICSPEKIIVISASSWQINDGATSQGYLSNRAFHQLDLVKQLKLLNFSIKDTFYMYRKTAEYVCLSALEKMNINFFNRADPSVNTGFRPVQGEFSKLEEAKTEEFIRKHPWYKNIKLDGFRWQIFANAFKELGKLQCTVIIFQPPVSRYWKTITRGTFIDGMEKEYSSRLSVLASEYSNIHFLDFYSNDIIELQDSMYYDFQHLNENGAKVFSEYLAERINEISEPEKNLQNR